MKTEKHLNLATIHDEVVNALKANTAKVKQRRETIAALAKALEKQKTASSTFGVGKGVRMS